MRNLKKILALVLVLVMSLSVMSVASAAYADADDINNVEAVAVMSGVGIFNGIDGEFQPQGNLTREQAAKIVSYMLLGKKTADALPNDTQPFADIEAGRWSSGSIAYCASLGIVSGRDGINYDPTANVTGYEFGKMVMVAAGINGNFTGSGYEFAVATTLADNNLLVGLDGVILSQPMTREQACQLSFNGLIYTANGGETGKWLVEYTGSDANLGKALASVKFDSYFEAYTAVKALEASADCTIVPEVGISNSLADKKHDLALWGDTTDFGVVSTGWSNKNGKTVYYSVQEEPIYTVANKTISAADLHTLLGVKAKESKDVNVYTNAASANGTITAVEKGTATVGGNGIVTSVYWNGVEAKVVEVSTYFTTVTKVNEAVKPSAENPNGVPAYVDLANGLTIETEAYKEGDALLVTIAENEVQSHELADAVIGTIDEYAGSKSVTVKGIAYKWADTATASIPADGFDVAHVFYTDGVNVYSIVDVAEAPAAAVVADGYAYVTDWQVAYEGKAGTAGDLFESATEGTVSAAAKAVIVTLDGTTKVVNLAVSYDAKAKEYSVNTPAGEKLVITAPVAKESVGIWAAYTLVNGEYNFIPMTGATVAPIAVAKSYKAGELFLNSATTYTNINIHEKNWKVNTVTGYKNIEIDAAEALIFTTTNNKTGEVTINSIYEITTNGPEAAVTTANYAYAVEAGSSVKGGTKWTFYINGAAKTDVVATGVEVVAGTVYDLTYTDGVITAATLVAAIDPEAAVEVTIANADYFVAGGTDYTYAKNIAVYNLKTGAVDTIEAGAKVVVAVADKGAAVLVYVVG